MEKKANTLKGKKRRFWLLTAVSSVLVIAIVSFAVLITYQIPWRYDMTAQRIFTLSQQTLDILGGLEEPVQIAAVYPEGQEEQMVTSLLDEYKKASDNIIVEYVDAEREPTKLAKYELDVSAVTNGTLIVKSGERSKIIENTSLFETNELGSVFNGEREITGAVRYVTTDEMPVVYFVQGHDEADPASVMTKAVSALQQDAYETKTVTLLQAGGVPEDADILIFASPKSDLSQQELEMVQKFTMEGGKVLFLVDSVMNTNSITLDNFNTWMNEFGLDITNNYVVEEDASYHLSNQPLYLIPGFGPHEITQKIAESKKMVILPVVRGIGEIEYDKNPVSQSILMVSSDKSWVRSDMTIPTSERTEADMAGPMPLAYAVTRSNVKWGNDAARVVVIGNSSFAYDGNIEVQANRDLFLNCVNWLQGGRDSDLIASKVINADRLIIRGDDFIKLTVICMGVLPGIAFLGALAVWVLRRNQ